MEKDNEYDLNISSNFETGDITLQLSDIELKNNDEKNHLLKINDKQNVDAKKLEQIPYTFVLFPSVYVYKNNEHKLMVSIKKNESIFNSTFFSLNGMIKIDGKEEEISTSRRYSHFDYLNNLITEKFYYLILPVLPENDIKFKFYNQKEALCQRRWFLELYINDLLNIPEIYDFEPFKLFLRNSEDFEFSLKNEKNIIQKNGSFFESTRNIIKSFLFRFNKSKINDDEFKEEWEIIVNLEKFVENIKSELRNYKSSSLKMFSTYQNYYKENKELDHIEKYTILKKMFEDKDKERNYECHFKNMIPILDNISYKIKKCKSALERQKNKSYEVDILRKEFLDDKDSDEKIVKEKKYQEGLVKKGNIRQSLAKELGKEIEKINDNLSRILNQQVPLFFTPSKKNG